MSGFSDKLEQCMKECGINAAELAQELGVDRTTIFRYMKGKREPKDAKIVKGIADALHMTLQDRKQFMEEYDNLILGEQVVKGYQYVERLFKHLGNEKQEHRNTFWDIKKQAEVNFFCLNSRREIEMCVLALFWALEQREEEVVLQILMQPEYEEIQNALSDIFGKQKVENIRIEQIICLEQQVQKSYENLERFQQVLPLCFSDISYEARYYYDSVKNHINEMSWTPNVILAGNCAVQFDYDMSQGIFVCNEKYAGAIRSQYEHFRGRSLPLVIKGSGVKEIMPFYEELLTRTENRTVAVTFTEPCIGSCISREICEAYLMSFLEKEQLIAQLEHFYGKWKGTEYLPPEEENEVKVESYFCMKGIRRFMETGIMREFPESYYHPAPMKLRRLILARMIKLLKSGRGLYRLLPEEVSLPENISFYWGADEKQLCINCIKPEDILQIKIGEPGICQVFRQWLEYMDKKGMMLSVEETLDALRRLAEEYRQA